MTHRGKWAVVWLGILVVAPALLAQSRFPRGDFHPMRPQGQQQKGVLPTQPSGPVAPVSLDQLPASPPQVSYQNGSLTIIAENSTLGDILREVHKATGASIDVPANANERVVARLGPAPARDVLASLLNGSSFNYVMVGSVTDPAALTSLMLTARTGGAIAAVTQTAEVYQPPVRTGFVPPPMGSPVMANADDSADDSEDAEDKDDEESAPGQLGQPGQPVLPDANNSVQPTPDPSQPNAGPKNPQQIMEMLRKSMPQQPQNNVPQDPPE